MITKFLAILEKYPHFIFIYKVRGISKSIAHVSQDLVIQTINSHSTKHRTLVLHMCWAIGEYCSYSVSSTLCRPDICSDFEESLELLAFECMVTVEEDERSVFSRLLAKHNRLRLYNNQLMSVLISALSKLAARCPALSSRVSLCLLKIERYEHFDEDVLSRAMECLNLLKFPRYVQKSIFYSLVTASYNLQHCCCYSRLKT